MLLGRLAPRVRDPFHYTEGKGASPVRARCARTHSGYLKAAAITQSVASSPPSSSESMPSSPSHWAEPKVKMDYFQKMTSTTRERYGQDRYHAGSNTVLVRTTLHTHI